MHPHEGKQYRQEVMLVIFFPYIITMMKSINQWIKDENGDVVRLSWISIDNDMHRDLHNWQTSAMSVLMFLRYWCYWCLTTTTRAAITTVLLLLTGKQWYPRSGTQTVTATQVNRGERPASQSSSDASGRENSSYEPGTDSWWTDARVSHVLLYWVVHNYV